MTKHIHTPEDPRVFVFGSNVRGIHGAGAAYYAHKSLGAAWGFGEGMTGRTYALPTCELPGYPLSLARVEGHVRRFLDFARANPSTRFFVSEVGCGFAGFSPEEIAPLFAGAPKNCDLPPDWRSMPDLPFTMRLVVGDWSHDGHSKSKDINIRSNRSAEQLKDAYTRGVPIVGLDLQRDVCRQYEDSTLLAEDLVKLIDAGWKIPGIEDATKCICDDTEYLEPEEFAAMWLFIASKGDPELAYELVEVDDRFPIGGYGLFST